MFLWLKQVNKSQLKNVKKNVGLVLFNDMGVSHLFLRYHHVSLV